MYWDGPDEKGLAAAALGEGPFTYGVELVLDGAGYVATATWPADEIVGNEPSAALHFTPEPPGPLIGRGLDETQLCRRAALLAPRRRPQSHP